VYAIVEFPTPGLDLTRISALTDFAKRASGLSAVSRVIPLTSMRTPPDSKLAAFDVVSPFAPESEQARAVVRALRSERSVADGRLYVGGQTAGDLDTQAYLVDRAPRAVAFVVSVTVVMLYLLLGSVLLPLKAVVVNFLSISGSFGALVWVFQEGHLFVSHPYPIEPSLPVLLFAALFGMSMDYEVLMLSRMKEAHDRTADDRFAVAEGLERSAGLISSAAAIMVAVFTAFALARVVLIQAMGFGMALAVALDASIVRLLVVPATMRLLGHLNWWAPGPLVRFHRASERWLARGA
jgi:RND superfamily putative drug exporter